MIVFGVASLPHREPAFIQAWVGNFAHLAIAVSPLATATGRVTSAQIAYGGKSVSAAIATTAPLEGAPRRFFSRFDHGQSTEPLTCNIGSDRHHPFNHRLGIQARMTANVFKLNERD